MLSYQHIYHAGNHADILKHTMLVMLLEHLNAKEKPYTVIDTHAGSGRYSTRDERALKTRDADTGINKILRGGAGGDAGSAAANDEPHDETVARTACTVAPVHDETIERAKECASFAQYCDFAHTCLLHGFYPGSPEIARAFMRKGDCLILCELHKAEFSALKNNMKLEPVAAGTFCPVAQNAGIIGNTNVIGACTKKEVACDGTNVPVQCPKDANNGARAAGTLADFPQNVVHAHVHCRDGFDALTSLTPPKIKRGLVLVDPSYEDADEYERVPHAFASLAARWRGAIFALWYPLLFHRRIACNTMKQKIIARAKSSVKECSIVDVQLCVNTEYAHREIPLAKRRKCTQQELCASDRVAVNVETMTLDTVVHKLSEKEHAFGTVRELPEAVHNGETVLPVANPPRLYGSGMLIVNAPWKLSENMKVVLPYFAKTLGVDGHGSWSIERY